MQQHALFATSDVEYHAPCESGLCTAYPTAMRKRVRCRLCNTVIDVADISYHRHVCPLRTVRCLVCSRSMYAWEKPQHREVCKSEPLFCIIPGAPLPASASAAPQVDSRSEPH